MTLADREYQRLHRLDEVPPKTESHVKKWAWRLFFLAVISGGVYWWLHR